MSSENKLILDKSKNNMKKTILEIIDCSLFGLILCGLLWSLKYIQILLKQTKTERRIKQ